MKTTILAAALIALGCAADAIAQSSSASFEIRRQSIDAGAARASSASYTVEGSIGQPDASPLMSSASYELRGGFHRPATPSSPLPDPLFADGFEG